MSLFGRTSSLARLTEWAESSEPATLHICGEAGIGKSALVQAWSHARNDTLLLSCEQLHTPEDLASALAKLLGAQDGWLEDAMNARGATILILDDADAATDVLQLLPHWRQTVPSWRIIITARRASGPKVLNLKPLKDEDAEALMRAHADATAWANAAPTARAALLHLLDGNPLAIMLATGRTRLLGIEEITQRLRDQRRTLGGGLGRFASLSEAFSLSWEALDAESQRLLGDALVFRGSFDLEAAEHILETHTHDILDIISTWGEHHVIRTVSQSPLRVSICRALRADIRARSHPPDDTLFTRYAEHFAQRAEQYPRSSHMVQHLPHELSDILGAREHLPHDPRLLTFLGWLLAHRHVTTNWGTPTTPPNLSPRDEAVALQNLAIGWVQRGEPARARRPLETALDLLEPDDPLQGDLRVALFKVCLRSGDMRAAAVASESLWKHALKLKDPRQAAKAAWRGARLWQELKIKPNALRCLERVMELGDAAPSLQTPAMMLQARLLFGLDDTRALQILDELTVRLRLSPDPTLSAQVHELYGDIHARQRNFTDAAGSYALATNLEGIASKHHDALAMAGHLQDAHNTLTQEDTLRRAMHLAFQDDWDGAIALAEHTLEAHPQDAIADRALAIMELLRALRTPNPESITVLHVLTERQPPEDRPIFEVFLARAQNQEHAPPGPHWHVSATWSDWFAHIAQSLTAPEHRDPTQHQWDLVRQRSITRPGMWIERDSLDYMIAGEHYTLGRKQLLKRLLRALVEQRTTQPGCAVSADDLFAAGWPDERGVLHEAALNRLRVAVRRLRANGLEELLLTREDQGYLLDPDIPMECFELTLLK